MKTLVVLAFALAVSRPATAQDEERLSPTLIAQVLAQTAADTPLPQQLDPTTTMVDVRASGLVLTYVYETSEVATEGGFRQFFALNNVPKICADEDVRFAFRQGVKFRYSYLMTASETEPFVIEVGSSDCDDTLR